MMMSTRLSVAVDKSHRTRWSPFESQQVIPAGVKEITGKKTIYSKFTSWAGIVTLICATVAFVILILIYIGKKETTRPASTATNNPALCPCQAVSSNSLFFPYGEEAGDYTDEGRSGIIHWLPRSFQCKPLGYYSERYDTTIFAYINLARLDIFCKLGKDGAKIHLCCDKSLDDPSSIAGYYFYHRKASEKENALFSCIIPNFKAVEVHVFTWINATTTGYTDIVGSFQAVYLVAKDSTAYLIRNYGDDFAGIPGESKQFYIDRQDFQKVDENLSVDDMKGKRDIILISNDVYGTSIPRTEEQNIGPCPEM